MYYMAKIHHILNTTQALQLIDQGGRSLLRYVKKQYVNCIYARIVCMLYKIYKSFRKTFKQNLRNTNLKIFREKFNTLIPKHKIEIENVGILHVEDITD